MSVVDKLMADAKDVALGLPIVEASVNTFVSGFEMAEPKTEKATRLLVGSIVSFVVLAASRLLHGNRLFVLLFLAHVRQGLQVQMEAISNGAELVEIKPYQGGQS
ncbi:MAG: hypothetical protein RL145_2301 [Pseudomonadota bacterium]|jgi:hypothetical protein